MAFRAHERPAPGRPIAALTATAATSAEKPAQQLAALVREHATRDIDAMVVAFVLQHVEHAAGRAGLRIGRAVDHARDARMHDRTGAHHAGLERHVQRRSWKAIVAAVPAGIAQRLHFRMRGRIAEGDVAIPTFADDFAVLHDNSADRHLAVARLRMARKFERPVHPGAIGIAAGNGCWNQDILSHRASPFTIRSKAMLSLADSV